MNYINKYISYLRLLNYSECTCILYQRILLQFYDEFKNDYLELRYQDFEKYITKLENKKYSNASLNQIISTLKSFYRFLLKTKVITHSDVLLLSYYKRSLNLDIVSKKDMRKLLDYSNYSDSYLDLRNLLIFELLYSTAIRVNELVNIKVVDILLYDSKILVLAKNRQERYVMFGSRCKKLLIKYLKVRKEYLEEFDCVYLLLNLQKKKLTTFGVRYIINSVTKKLDIKKHIYPHLIRHTVASELHENDASTEFIQKLLGHKHIETTAHYIYVSKDHLKNSYKKYHPRSKEK